MEILNYKVALLIIFFTTSFLGANTPNIISSREYDISTELMMYFYDDVKERYLLSESGNEFTADSLRINDSIRFSRVIHLDTNNLLVKLRDKHYAAWIYLHNNHYERGIELCDEIINSEDNEYFLYLYDSLDNEKIDKEYGWLINKMDYELIKKLDNGNFLIKISIKDQAQSLKILLKKHLDKNDSEKITIKSIEDFSTQKEKIRLKIREHLKEQFPSKEFTDDEVDRIIDQQKEYLEKLIDKTKETYNEESPEK